MQLTFYIYRYLKTKSTGKKKPPLTSFNSSESFPGTQANTDELFGLCSGKFVGMDKSIDCILCKLISKSTSPLLNKSSQNMFIFYNCVNLLTEIAKDFQPFSCLQKIYKKEFLLKISNVFTGLILTSLDLSTYFFCRLYKIA